MYSDFIKVIIISVGLSCLEGCNQKLYVEHVLTKYLKNNTTVVQISKKINFLSKTQILQINANLDHLARKP